ncbi:hypothetical protein, partial [Pseudomonas mosselii]|uniref:hypothetical protein n=1 Tax=Pseudomonas mosselii TaxID=78327 RepID=UPI001A7E0936
SSLGILGRSRKGFFLVGIHAPLTHVMPEHKISDTLIVQLSRKAALGQPFLFTEPQNQETSYIRITT